VVSYEYFWNVPVKKFICDSLFLCMIIMSFTVYTYHITISVAVYQIMYLYFSLLFYLPFLQVDFYEILERNVYNFM
jgi:hypothetical protein